MRRRVTRAGSGSASRALILSIDDASVRGNAEQHGKTFINPGVRTSVRCLPPA
jgi:hypothetical protein